MQYPALESLQSRPTSNQDSITTPYTPYHPYPTYCSSHPCRNCQQYIELVHELQDRVRASERRQKKLNKALQKLEKQNQYIFSDTDQAVKEFEDHIRKLETELRLRDQTVRELLEDIRELQQLNQQLQRTLTIENTKQQHTQTVIQESIKKKEEIQNLQQMIFKLITQKSANEKKMKQDYLKWETQKNRMLEDHRALMETMEQKENLIRSLSESNDQLRMQVVKLRSEKEMREIQWAAEQRRVMEMDYTKTINQLKIQNDQLKTFNKSLQHETQELIKAAEELEGVLARTRLERDLLEKMAELGAGEKKSLKTVKSGSICRNLKVPQMSNQTSKQTSITSEIIQQNFDFENNSSCC